MRPILWAVSTTTKSPRCCVGLDETDDRVMYSPLAPRKADFDLVRDLMIETGVLDRKIEFNEYTDTRFSGWRDYADRMKYEHGIAVAR